MDEVFDSYLVVFPYFEDLSWKRFGYLHVWIWKASMSPGCFDRPRPHLSLDKGFPAEVDPAAT